MQNILLISPSFNQKVWDYFPEMPLGLAYIATYIKKKERNIKIIDYNVTSFSIHKFREILKNFKPNYVGISCTYGAINNAIIIAETIKQNHSCKIVLGGLAATFILDDIAKKTSSIDIYVRGEGEITFNEIISNRDIGKIAGLSYIKDGNLIHNCNRSNITNLDKLGLPDRSFFPLRKYKRRFTRYSSTIIETLRGCPYDCDFCTQPPKEGNMLRLRSPEIVINDLINISKYKFIRHIGVIDNDFLLNQKHAREILSLIKKNNLNKRFDIHIATRVEHLIHGGESLLFEMKQANISSIFIGLESLSTKKIHAIGKIKNIQQTRDIIKTYSRNKIEIFPSYIIGYPEEQRNDILETLQFAQSINTRSLVVSILTPYPGTKLYSRYLNENIIKLTDYNKYDNQHQIIKHKLNLHRELIRFRRSYFLRFKYFTSNNCLTIPLISFKKIKSFIIYLADEFSYLKQKYKK